MTESTLAMVMFLMIFCVYAFRKKRGAWSRWVTPLCVVGLGIAGIALGSRREGLDIGEITGGIFVVAGLWLAFQEARRTLGER